jgi:hypothetical protein
MSLLRLDQRAHSNFLIRVKPKDNANALDYSIPDTLSNNNRYTLDKKYISDLLDAKFALSTKDDVGDIKHNEDRFKGTIYKIKQELENSKPKYPIGFANARFHDAETDNISSKDTYKLREALGKIKSLIKEYIRDDTKATRNIKDEIVREQNNDISFRDFGKTYNYRQEYKYKVTDTEYTAQHFYNNNEYDKALGGNHYILTKNRSEINKYEPLIGRQDSEQFSKFVEKLNNLLPDTLSNDEKNFIKAGIISAISSIRDEIAIDNDIKENNLPKYVKNSKQLDESLERKTKEHEDYQRAVLRDLEAILIRTYQNEDNKNLVDFYV